MERDTGDAPDVAHQRRDGGFPTRQLRLGGGLRLEGPEVDHVVGTTRRQIQLGGRLACGGLWVESNPTDSVRVAYL